MKLVTSSEKTKFHVITAGSPSLGFGHLKRSKVLSGQMEKEGLSVRRSVASDINVSLENLYSAGEVLLVDLPPTIQRRVKWRQLPSERIVTFDSRSIKGEIDFSLDMQIRELARVNYKGYNFAIIGEEFQNSTNKKGLDSTFGNRVCICIGGGDIRNNGPKAAEFLSDMGFQVTLILGPFAREAPSQLRKINVRLVRNPVNLHEFFTNSDWLIVNGGGTLFEALTIGKPTFSLPQTTEELIIARDLLTKGAILGIGLNSLSLINTLTVTQVRRVVDVARKTFDGLGSHRITKILMERYL